MYQTLTYYIASKRTDFTANALHSSRQIRKMFWMLMGITLNTKDMPYLLYTFLSNKKKKDKDVFVCPFICVDYSITKLKWQ